MNSRVIPASVGSRIWGRPIGEAERLEGHVCSVHTCTTLLHKCFPFSLCPRSRSAGYLFILLDLDSLLVCVSEFSFRFAYPNSAFGLRIRIQRSKINKKLQIVLNFKDKLNQKVYYELICSFQLFSINYFFQRIDSESETAWKEKARPGSPLRF